MFMWSASSGGLPARRAAESLSPVSIVAVLGYWSQVLLRLHLDPTHVTCGMQSGNIAPLLTHVHYYKDVLGSYKFS